MERPPKPLTLDQARERLQGMLDPNIDTGIVPRFANWAGGGSPMVQYP